MLIFIYIVHFKCLIFKIMEVIQKAPNNKLWLNIRHVPKKKSQIRKETHCLNIKDKFYIIFMGFF